MGTSPFFNLYSAAIPELPTVYYNLINVMVSLTGRLHRMTKQQVEHEFKEVFSLSRTSAKVKKDTLKTYDKDNSFFRAAYSIENSLKTIAQA